MCYGVEITPAAVPDTAAICTTAMPATAMWLIIRGKSNFFERRVGEYQKAGVMAGLAGPGGRQTHEHFVFTTDADF